MIFAFESLMPCFWKKSFIWYWRGWDAQILPCVFCNLGKSALCTLHQASGSSSQRISGSSRNLLISIWGPAVEEWGVSWVFTTDSSKLFHSYPFCLLSWVILLRADSSASWLCCLRMRFKRRSSMASMFSVSWTESPIELLLLMIFFSLLLGASLAVLKPIDLHYWHGLQVSHDYLDEKLAQVFLFRISLFVSFFPCIHLV